MKANMKTYLYPNSIRIGAFISKLLSILFILYALYSWIVSRPSDYNSLPEYLIGILLVTILPIISLGYAYLWPTVKVDYAGLYIESISKYQFVPWEDICSISHIGSRTFGAWVIRTSSNRLTSFHALYGIWYTLTLNRCFIVHPLIDSCDELINVIRSNASK